MDTIGVGIPLSFHPLEVCSIMRIKLGITALLMTPVRAASVHLRRQHCFAHPVLVFASKLCCHLMILMRSIVKMCWLKLSCAQTVMLGKRESLSLTSDFLFLKTIPSCGLIFHLRSKPDTKTLEPGNLVVISFYDLLNAMIYAG